MTIIKKSLLASAVSALALSSAVSVQAEGFDSVIKDSTLDFNFRLRVETVDKDNALDDALATTLKSRATFKSGEIAGFSVLVEGDNVTHIVDDFNSTQNGKSNYNVVPDPETTQFNQAYIQYKITDTTVKLGNQRILLDNQRHVGGVAWRQDEVTFDAISVSSKAIENMTVFVAIANNRNNILNINTEEDITFLNAKYAVSKDLAVTGFYYSISDANGIDGLDFDTFGARATGMAGKISFEAELATQNKTTAGGGDFDSLYYHVNAGTKLGSVKATLGYEAFGSDDGQAAFATPLGTNHKFLGWSDVYLTGAGVNGIQDIYASAVTKISGIKLVGQFHKFDAVEGNADLGTELGFVAAKKFDNLGVALKVAYLSDSDMEDDTTKIWLTGTAKF
ncbi:MAG: hypothetical protein ACJA0E_002202 [Bermanella sp.]|jgi:hypothetical protein